MRLKPIFRILRFIVYMWIPCNYWGVCCFYCITINKTLQQIKMGYFSTTLLLKTITFALWKKKRCFRSDERTKCFMKLKFLEWAKCKLYTEWLKHTNQCVMSFTYFLTILHHPYPKRKNTKHTQALNLGWEWFTTLTSYEEAPYKNVMGKKGMGLFVHGSLNHHVLHTACGTFFNGLTKSNWKPSPKGTDIRNMVDGLEIKWPFASHTSSSSMVIATDTKLQSQHLDLSAAYPFRRLYHSVDPTLIN